MIWQIFPQSLLLILVSLTIVTLYATDALKNLYLQRTSMDLEARGRLISRILLPGIKNLNISLLNKQVRDLSVDHQIRITLILPDGRVIADSDEAYDQMENHADRQEIRKAYEGDVGSSSRFSYTLNLEMLYVAVPIVDQNKIIAVVRTSMPSSHLQQTLHTIYRKIGFAGLLVMIIAGIIGFLYIYFLNKPIQTIKQGALLFGEGDLSHRIYITKPEELKTLADSMNQMADQLLYRIEMISNQRNELEAILSGMVEAVFVVDANEHILRINHAMSRLFKIDPLDTIGKDLQAVVRNIGLQRFVRRTLNTEQPQEEEFIVINECECTVQAHGSLLKDAHQNTIGGLIVLNDITRQKALENMRKEFVANVSHELKTPITAIHGFVETLREGAIHDKKKAPEFLDIIIRHTERLNTIIEDLLDLSRIEDSGKSEITLSRLPVLQVLQVAAGICQSKADEKHIRVQLDCKPGLEANMNAPLLEQAMVNLVDNAIKYSPEESLIMISAQKIDGKISIRVLDNGSGIPAKDLPRIFERFYRVDKARSRNLGGTGLGLSIVKHIAQAHGGAVTVESKPGEGSTFTLSIPA